MGVAMSRKWVWLYSGNGNGFDYTELTKAESALILVLTTLSHLTNSCQSIAVFSTTPTTWSHAHHVKPHPFYWKMLESWSGQNLTNRSFATALINHSRWYLNWYHRRSILWAGQLLRAWTPPFPPSLPPSLYCLTTVDPLISDWLSEHHFTEILAAH